MPSGQSMASDMKKCNSSYIFGHIAMTFEQNVANVIVHKSIIQIFDRASTFLVVRPNMKNANMYARPSGSVWVQCVHMYIE